MNRPSLLHTCAAVLGGALLAACADVELGRVGPEVVPAGDLADSPTHPAVGRFWAEVRPSAGRLDLYEIYPGNVIYRGRAVQSLKYDYQDTATQGNCGSETCQPPTGLVALFTNQSHVTYVDGSGNCIRNGVVFTGDRSCNGKYTSPGDPCRNNHTFCGPIQMISNVTFGQAVGAMPNVVLQVQPSAGVADNLVVGCNDEDPDGIAGPQGGRHGLCAFTEPTKVDDPTTSNLTSPVPGSPPATFGCSFCYGNELEANNSGRPGLEHAVLSDATGNGVDTALAAVNTNNVVFQLQNDNDLDVVITVRYARPALADPGLQIDLDDAGAPATCVRRGTTRMTVNGASFGPPSECLTGAQPAPACPLEGGAATGHRINVPGLGALAPSLWSDTRVEHTPAAQSTTECGVTVSTPAGTTATSDALPICDDQWRSWTPTLAGSPVTRISAAAGVLTAPSGNRFIVVNGGRTAVNDRFSFTGSTDHTLLMPVPSCADPNPNWSAITSWTGVATLRWGAAHAVVGNQLYVVGGSLGNGTCEATGRRISLTSDTTAAFQDLGNIAPGLCHATLTVVRDEDGKDWLILTGGSRVAVPGTCGGGVQPAQRSFRLDPAAANPTWIQITGIPAVDHLNTSTPLWRFGSGAATSGDGLVSLVVGGSSSTSAPGSALTTASGIFMDPDLIPGMTIQLPHFIPATSGFALPAGRFAPGVAAADGFIYVAGGATAIAPAGCNTSNAGQLPATSTLHRRAAAAIPIVGGPWTTLADMPAARAEHAVVVAESTGGTEDKLFVIGGHDGSAAGATAVLEYTP